MKTTKRSMMKILMILALLPSCVTTTALQENYVMTGENKDENIDIPVEQVRHESSFYLAKKTLVALKDELARAEELLKSNPYNLQSFKVIAIYSLACANPEGPLVMLETIEKRGVKLDSEAYFLRGIARLYRNETQVGLNDIRYASSLNPTNVLPDLNLGIYYLNRGSLNDARTFLERALNLEPQNTVAHLHLGITFLRLKNLENAEKHLKMATKSRELQAQALYHLGVLEWEGKKNTTQAKKIFQRIMDLPQAPDELKNKAYAALESIRNNQALQTYPTVW